MALNAGPSRRHTDIGFAVALIVVAAAAYMEAGSYPGLSGNYPRVVAAMLAAGAAVVIVRDLLRKREANEPRFFHHMGRVLLGFVVLGLYIIAIDMIGYVIPSLVVAIGLPLLLGYQGVRLPALVAVGTLAFIIVVFFILLERPLPPDVFDPILKALRR